MRAVAPPHRGDDRSQRRAVGRGDATGREPMRHGLPILAAMVERMFYIYEKIDDVNDL